MLVLMLPASAKAFDLGLGTTGGADQCQLYMQNLEKELRRYQGAYDRKNDDDLRRLMSFMFSETSNVMDCSQRYKGTPLEAEYGTLLQQKSQTKANTSRLIDHDAGNSGNDADDAAKTEHESVLHKVATSSFGKVVGTVAKIIYLHYAYGI